MCLATLMVAQSVTPKKCRTCDKPLAQCQYKGRHPKQTVVSQKVHEWVDLGLPSGTKWATMNVGATSPNDYGSYFAWGETSPKSNYTWKNLKYRPSSGRDNEKLSKKAAETSYGNVDGKKELDLIDDAAYVNWGSDWRMPSFEQVKELIEICKWTWTPMGGHNGYMVVGPNGNSIFLPTAGCKDSSGLMLVDKKGEFSGIGYYWSRTLYTHTYTNEPINYNDRASVISFWPNTIRCHSLYRDTGAPVRAVRISE